MVEDLYLKLLDFKLFNGGLVV